MFHNIDDYFVFDDENVAVKVLKPIFFQRINRSDFLLVSKSGLFTMNDFLWTHYPREAIYLQKTSISIRFVNCSGRLKGVTEMCQSSTINKDYLLICEEDFVDAMNFIRNNMNRALTYLPNKYAHRKISK